jgi:hypothetical protein
VRILSRLRRRRPAVPSVWDATLLVVVDEQAGVFRPRVELVGSPLPSPALLRVELVDGAGLTRLALAQPIGHSKRDIDLPAVGPPGGASLEEVARWRWDVVLEDDAGELAGWCEYLVAHGLNAEAELAHFDLRDR